MGGERAEGILAHRALRGVDAGQAEVALADLRHVGELDVLHVREGHQAIRVKMLDQLLVAESLVQTELVQTGQDGFLHDFDHVRLLGLLVDAAHREDVLGLGDVPPAESLAVALDHFVEHEIDGKTGPVADENEAVTVADFTPDAGDADSHLARPTNFVGVMLVIDDLDPPELADDGRNAQQEKQPDDLDAGFSLEQSHDRSGGRLDAQCKR